MAVLHEIDLRALSELRGPERAFLSLYSTWPDGLKPLEARARQVRALLADAPDELEHFERSLELARARLESDPPPAGPACATPPLTSRRAAFARLPSHSRGDLCRDRPLATARQQDLKKTLKTLPNGR